MEENKNPPDRHGATLVFDVMPTAGGSTEPRQPPKQTQQPARAAIPELPPELQPPISNKSRGFKLPRFSINWKVAVGIAVVLVLGVGGYFAYPLLFKNQAEDTSISTPPPLPETVMPGEWLKKYFRSENCPDATICGPSADPDEDGLTNREEADAATDPLNADTDYDGLADGDELAIYTTEPMAADTDGDGFEDGQEVRNSYSPKLAESSPMPQIEKLEIDTNIQSHGLHGATGVFLAMQQFDTRFEPSSTSTPQISMSVPKDWVISGSSNEKTLRSPSKNDFISLTLAEKNPAAQADLNAAWLTASTLTSGAKDLGQKDLDVGNLMLKVDEQVIPASSGTSDAARHILRAMFLKSGRIFDVVFSADDTEWPDVSATAWAAITSIR